ncbi:translesion DNA synthesis-associated protein ImuA [Aquabacterium sp. J223]|uniref:translesion DNA synthesis-associated protein ImuA n=1 Tax=Aquabacterium sp. J223 TaxID=2898431 RepID=UPI0021AD825B|nr:translesion DNA synthesis-associated protein ImuA [Aquabacterium sp. J223]UUX94010.1 translesion DNA synthesis-associated protein ImuA [Aquabacterium sp. J223]
MWRAHQLGQQRSAVLPTGHAVLDAQLPGGGWPHAAVTELLLPQAGTGELRLLAPALRAVQQRGRCLLVVAPPWPLCGSGWQRLGLALAALLVVHPLPSAAAAVAHETDRLWALEQVLKSGHAGAVLAWLPTRVRADALRRLQLAAQRHDGPVFLMREAAAAGRPSPAPLRLLLQAEGADRLGVHLLKRRGPALPAPLHLDLPPVVPVLDDRPLASPPADAPQPARVPPGPAPLPTRLQRLASADAPAGR